MTVFFQTKNFIVESYDQPHVCRTDGGHVCIRPKEPVENRWDLDKDKAQECMLLSMVVGQAMKQALIQRNIPIERMNIQDNGNWSIDSEKGPKFHLHIYGRAKNSMNQKRGEALYLPEKATKFYEQLEPLNQEDRDLILTNIKKLIQEEKYNSIPLD